jgi:hypothetical protein
MTVRDKATRIDLNQSRNGRQQKNLNYQLPIPVIADSDPAVDSNPIGLGQAAAAAVPPTTRRRNALLLLILAGRCGRVG